MGFLSRSDGQNVGKQESYESNFIEVLPKGTRITAIAEVTEWRGPSDIQIDEFVKKFGLSMEEAETIDVISVQWRAEGGQFDGRVVFQKLHVLSPDPKKRDSNLDAYAAVDTILNEGLLLELGEEPSDEELERAWCGKKADLVLGVWKSGKGADMQSGNFVQGVFPAGSGGTLQAGANGGRQRRSTAGAVPEATPARTRVRRTDAAPAAPAAPVRQRRVR